jgi:hypothetical protein
LSRASPYARAVKGAGQAGEKGHLMVHDRRTTNPVTQCNQNQSPARFSRKRPQRQRHAETFGTMPRLNIKFGTRRLIASGKEPAHSGLSCDFAGKSSSDRTGWLAQQCRRSPALPVFPANREFYREFREIAALDALETLTNGAVTGLSMRFPYSTEQGINLVEQGNFARQ